MELPCSSNGFSWNFPFCKKNNRQEQEEIKKTIRYYHEKYPSLHVYDKMNEDFERFLDNIDKDDGKEALGLLETFFKNNKSEKTSYLGLSSLSELGQKSCIGQNHKYKNIYLFLHEKFGSHDILGILESKLDTIVKAFRLQKIFKINICHLFKIIYRIVEIIEEKSQIRDNLITRCRRLIKGKFHYLQRDFKEILSDIIYTISDTLIDKEQVDSQCLINFYCYIHVLHDLGIIFLNYDVLIKGQLIDFKECDLAESEIISLESIRENQKSEALFLSYHCIDMYSKEKKKLWRKVSFYQIMVNIYAKLCMIKFSSRVGVGSS